MFNSLGKKLKSFTGLNDWKGLTKLEKIRMTNAVVSAFRTGIMGGSMMMLLNGTNVLILVANAFPIYHFMNMVLRPYKNKIAKHPDIMRLNYVSEYMITGTFSILILISLWVSPWVFWITIIIDYAASPIIDSINYYHTEFMKRTLYPTITEANVFKDKVEHTKSAVKLICYGIYGLVMLLAKTFGADMVLVFKILLSINSVIVWYDIYVTHIERKTFMELVEAGEVTPAKLFDDEEKEDDIVEETIAETV